MSRSRRDPARMDEDGFADADAVPGRDEARGPHLPDVVTRSWAAWVFVLLAVAFTAWFVWSKPLQAGSAADVVIYGLQLVPSVCAILVPAAFLARHPDAPGRAGTLLAGTILFALVQGLVILSDPLQVVFETLTPPSEDLPGLVPLAAVYSACISVVVALALAFMAVGLSQARRYEDRVGGWLTGWLVPAATIFAAVAGVLAVAQFYGDVAMSFTLAIYLGSTVVLGVVRLVVWANLLAVGLRGSTAGEDPSGGWVAATLGAAAVAAALVLVNLSNLIAMPSQDAATWYGYLIVAGYAAGNALVLLAFAVGLPVLGDDGEDDDWDDAAVAARG